MWKRTTVGAVAGIAWGVALADVFNLLPAAHDDSLSRFAGFVALAATARLMLWCHSRPIGQAYELGYYRGRRDQMREVNRRELSPIRRAAGGVSEFSLTHRRGLKRASIDA